MELRIINKYNNLHNFPHLAHDEKYMHKYCHSCGGRLSELRREINQISAWDKVNNLCSRCRSELLDGGYSHYRCTDVGFICHTELVYKKGKFNVYDYEPYELISNGHSCKWHREEHNHNRDGNVLTEEEMVYGWYSYLGGLFNSMEDALNNDIKIMMRRHKDMDEKYAYKIIMSNFIDNNRKSEDFTYANYEDINNLIILQK